VFTEVFVWPYNDFVVVWVWPFIVGSS